MDLGLLGRTALITGASKGIGFASAYSLAREGVNVHLAARTASDLEAAREKILSRFNVSVTTHPVDLSDGDAARGLVDACGEIDILVNNAGAIPGGDIALVETKLLRAALQLFDFGRRSRIELGKEEASLCGEANRSVGLELP